MIVLIADDVADNRELLSRLVQLQGHEPITASNGVEAIKQVRKHHPDVIFMDIAMPVMSGFEAVALIRRDPRFSETPIVAFTAHAMSPEIDACYDAGCNDVVTKPLDISHVQRLLIEYGESWAREQTGGEASNG